MAQKPQTVKTPVWKVNCEISFPYSPSVICFPNIKRICFTITPFLDGTLIEGLEISTVKMSKLFAKILISCYLLIFCQCSATEDRPSEASLKLAREIVSFYKNQNKQFFPYYPLDPYQRLAWNLDINIYQIITKRVKDWEFF